MKLFSFLILAPIVFGYSQEVRVLASIHAFYEDGRAFTPQEVVDTGTIAIIKKDGYLALGIGRKTSVFLNPGRFSIDSVVTAKRMSPAYKTRDSILTILEGVGWPACLKRELSYTSKKIEESIYEIDWRFLDSKERDGWVLIRRVFDLDDTLLTTREGKVRVPLPFSNERDGPIEFMIVTNNCIQSEWRLLIPK